MKKAIIVLAMLTACTLFVISTVRPIPQFLLGLYWGIVSIYWFVNLLSTKK